jgi:DNA-binding transcriptional ArsR family regulator
MAGRRSALTQAEAAPLFAALGDETRLSLLSRLSDGAPRSISQLTAGLDLTRQGVTKHLRILQDADMVRSRRLGRQNLFVIHPAGLRVARDYLLRASAQWDDVVARLAAFVEEEPGRR